MPDQVFISYAQADQAKALAVCKELERDGTACWIAPRDVPPAADWDNAIVAAIEGSDLFLLILSEHANGSRHVAREVALADARTKKLLAVRVEAAMPAGGLAYYLTASHWFDAFPPPLETHLSRLSTEVTRLLRGREVRPRKVNGNGAPRPFPTRLLFFGLGALVLSYVFYQLLSNGGGNGLNLNNGHNRNNGSPSPTVTTSPTPARGPIQNLKILFRTTDDAKDAEDAVRIAIRHGQSEPPLFKEEYGWGKKWDKFVSVEPIKIKLPREIPYDQCQQLRLEVSKSVSTRGWKALPQVEAEVDGKPVTVVGRDSLRQLELKENEEQVVKFDFDCP